MFEKLSKFASLAKSPKAIRDLNSLTNNLSSGIFKVVEDTFNLRRATKDNSNYNPEDVGKIVDMYAKRNMILAAASSIIPGPLGILGSVPQLVLNFGNQMCMIYDLGCAHGKENIITKDLLLDISLSAIGSNTQLTNIQNNLNLLQESPQDILIDKARSLGGGIVKNTLKKSVIQFVPIAGPIVMAAWSKTTTQKISATSLMVLDYTQHFEEHFKKEETEESEELVQLQKIKALATLIECNNDINAAQIEFISAIIKNSNLSDSEKSHLLSESIKDNSNFELNLEILKDYEEGENLIMELVILAKISGDVDNLEENYINSLGARLDIPPKFISNLLEAE